MRHLSLALCFIVALGAASCTKTAPPLGVAKPAVKACPNKIPFVAGYLPNGFSKQLQTGPASGKADLKNVTIEHYQGPSGAYVEFLRGGKRSPLGATKGMIVLNHLARIGPIPQGWAINFRIAAQRCAGFQIVLGGMPSSAKPGDELVKIGHGLQAVPTSS
jgi:hypothetical protein